MPHWGLEGRLLGRLDADSEPSPLATAELASDTSSCSSSRTSSGLGRGAGGSSKSVLRRLGGVGGVMVMAMLLGALPGGLLGWLDVGGGKRRCWSGSPASSESDMFSFSRLVSASCCAG